MAVNFTTWRYDAPYGAPVPGMFGPEPLFRDALDARRSAYRRVPEAEYPDGYLGTITSRHEDKLLRALKANETGRPTQRGVHKGETIDPGDYFWPKQFNDMTGLELEAQGKKFAPGGELNDRLVAEGRMPVPRGAMGIVTLNPTRAAQLRQLGPSWR
jgi:hypothetical protein